MEPLRYKLNHNAITKAEQSALRHKCVLVAGCGGLGGYVIEYLGRLGVGHIIAVDGDVFEESNLNRQLLSSNMNLGKPKVLAAQQRMKAVNPLVTVDAIQDFLTEDNAAEMMRGCDVVIDALDNISSRLLLQKAAKEVGIPLVHGAIAGWQGQVCTIQPGEDTLNILYGNMEVEKGAEVETGNLPFAAALVASVQAAEAVKLLLGRGTINSELLLIDLLNCIFDNIPLHNEPARPKENLNQESL